MPENNSVVCGDVCPGRYNSIPEDIIVVAELIGATISEKCLSVCSLIGNAYPESGVTNCRIKNSSTQETGDAGVVVRMPDGVCVPIMLPKK